MGISIRDCGEIPATRRRVEPIVEIALGNVSHPKNGDLESEAPLIARFQNGEEDALEEIISRHKSQLFPFIFRYINDHSEAEDVLYLTFVRAWKNRSRYRHKVRFQAWLFTIATNLCRDHCRKKKRRPGDFASRDDFDASFDPTKVEPSSHGGATGGRDPSAAAALDEETAALQNAIDLLPHEVKSALILFSIEGYSQEEAGNLLGCSAKAIEAKVYRAKKQLRKNLSWLRDF